MSEVDNPELSDVMAREVLAKPLTELFDDVPDTDEAVESDPLTTPALEPSPFRLRRRASGKDSMWQGWLKEYEDIGNDPKNKEELERAKQELRERGLDEWAVERQAALKAGTVVMARENMAPPPPPEPKIIHIIREKTDNKSLEEIDDIVLRTVRSKLETGKKVKTDEVICEAEVTVREYYGSMKRLREAGKIDDDSLKKSAKALKEKRIEDALAKWKSEHPDEIPNLKSILSGIGIDPGYGRYLLREMKKQTAAPEEN